MMGTREVGAAPRGPRLAMLVSWPGAVPANYKEEMVGGARVAGQRTPRRCVPLPGTGPATEG